MDAETDRRRNESTLSSPLPAVDVVVIGGSAGGVSALKSLVSELPADLPAAVMIVIHTAPTGGYLAPILDWVSPLEAAFARDGERIHRGRIYVAPPDRHLVVRGDHLHLTRTPKENWTRPAINPLFRSAAAAFGRRAAAVLLTGMLDNGVAGLLAVEAVGGTVIVQAPDDAEFPEMPQTALDYLMPDHLLPLRDMAQLLARLARGTATDGARRAGEPLTLEGPELNLDATGLMPRVDRTNGASGFTCPECGGPLWEESVRASRAPRGQPVFTGYVCRLGHRFGPETLLHERGRVRSDRLEAALQAVREEQALALRLLTRGRERLLDERKLQRRITQVHRLARLGDEIEAAIRAPTDMDCASED